ncbi:hypothetical protein Y032_0027g1588 [Ancylostoma ceylanicum]|nr:hypothetical protein Y032_0027g1588 [Ancylostoma ceylanicum]
MSNMERLDSSVARPRALKTHSSDETVATMDHIPDRLSRLPDGSMFVQRLEPTLHVYYNSNTVQMAAGSGLHALIADKVHSFQPRQLKRKGQLYTVHGICRNGVEVPLLYAISSKKTEQAFSDASVQGCTFPLGAGLEQTARPGWPTTTPQWSP